MSVVARLAASASCLIGVLTLPPAVSAHPAITRPLAPVSPEVARRVAELDGTSTGADDAMVRVIVSFDTGGGAARPSVSDVRSARSSVVAALPADTTVVSSFRHIPAVALEIDAAGLDALRRNPLVSSVDIDQTVSIMMSDANTLIGVGPLHTAGVTGEGITVAVIDTGVDSDAGDVHPSLADDIVGQACFRTENDCLGGPTSAEDQHGHGTHVTGIITGPQGAAPDANVYALKVFTIGNTSDANILNALDHVIALNTTTPGTIDAVNMSLGGDNFADQASCDAASTAYVTAFATLNAQNVSVFVATGNDAQTDEISSPGCATGAIGVGSVGDASFTKSFGACTDNGAPDKVSCFSNATPVQGTGELVDLLAPGCSITSTGLNGSTNFEICGTSMATPYAAGAAALVLEHAANNGVTLTPAALETLMEDTGVPVTDDRITESPAFPRVSPAAAIDAIHDANSATVAVTRPADGASFVRGKVVTADFVCSDDIGGTAIASCVGTVADGATIDTATTGTKTFTATVTNTLGKLTTVTHSYTVTEPPARPDARVRVGARGRLVGDDIYGSAARQTVRGAAQVGRSVTYTMSAQNDAAIADSFRLKGQGSKSGFTVRYTDNKGRNITAAVVAGSYRTARLAPGKTATITVKVTVTTKATSSLAGTIVARSTAQPARTDTVKILTARR